MVNKSDFVHHSSHVYTLIKTMSYLQLRHVRSFLPPATTFTKFVRTTILSTIVHCNCFYYSYHLDHYGVTSANGLDDYHQLSKTRRAT